MNQRTPKTPGIYCRLSYAPDGSPEKVERQEADSRQLAQRLGWPDVPADRVYSDNSRSAWQRNRKRPQWDRMLADIKAGRIDGIVVWHGDRLMRQVRDLADLLDLADERQIQLASVQGTRDLSDNDDRYILTIELAQASKSSADTSRRVKRGWAARAAKGHAIGGGKRPTGFGVLVPDKSTPAGHPYYDTTKHNPEEAAFLREAADRLLAGQSQGGVLAWLRECGHRTSQGKDFTSKTLKNVLTSPRIAGLVEHDGTFYGAVWEPIIDRETWEDLKAVFARSAAEYGYAGRQRKYLLTGIAECSGCGQKVRAKPTGGRNRKDSRIYYCANPECPARVGRNVRWLDWFVDGLAVEKLNEPSFVERVHAVESNPGIGAEIAALQRRKAEAQEQLENLADLPGVSAGTLAKSLASFDRKIGELRNQLATTSRQRLLAQMAGTTREQWDATPIDVRAETVKALFRITILPTTHRGPGFESADVRVSEIS